MSIFYRPHRGGLKEAMDKSKLFDNINQMFEHIVEQYNLFAIQRITKDDISISLYSDKPDYRIGWNRSYIIMIRNYPHGFFTDEYEENWEDIYNSFIEKIKV